MTENSATIEHHQGTENVKNFTQIVEVDSTANSIRVWSDEYDRPYKTFHNATVTSVEV